MSEYTGPLSVNGAAASNQTGGIWENPSGSKKWHVQVPKDGFAEGSITTSGGAFTGSWSPTGSPSVIAVPLSFSSKDAVLWPDGSLKWFRMEMDLGDR